MISVKALCSKDFTINLRNVIIIPTDLVINWLLSFFIFSCKPKARIRFSASWWSGNEKYFCFLFITGLALLQSHAEFNRPFFLGIFLHVFPVRIIVPWSGKTATNISNSSRLEKQISKDKNENKVILMQTNRFQLLY